MSPTSRSAALAWSSAGLVLLGASTLLPFVSAAKFGRSNEGRMFSGMATLWAQGDLALALLVGFCGFVAPLFVLLAVAVAAWRDEGRGLDARWQRWAGAIAPWSMPEVRLLAILVAFVKLSALVEASPAAGLWCYGAAAFCALAAGRVLRTEKDDEEPAPTRSGGAGAAAACGLAALLLLVPAYLLPVMRLSHGGRTSADTIMSSIEKLAHGGMWGLALVVFVASLLVPLLKLAGLGFLLAAGRWPGIASDATRHRLHAALHGVGRWSMLDVFLVAFLCGLVQFEGLAQAEAQPGVLAFAGVVVLTMFATSALDRPAAPLSRP